MEKSATKGLFEGVRYYAVGNLNEEIKNSLTNGKAKAESYLSALATHVIVSDPTNHEAEAARDLWQILTVKPSWVTLSIQCKKLLPILSTGGFSSSPNQLFSAAVICFSQISKKDKTSLWGLVTYNGGNCQSSLNKQCTHLVVPSPSGAKYEAALKHEDIAIVAPDWLIDSVKQKKLQPVEKYHPKLNIVPSPPKVPSPVKEICQDTVNNLKALSVADSFSGNTVKTTATKMKDVATILKETQQELMHKQYALGPTSTKGLPHTGDTTPTERLGIYTARSIPPFMNQAAMQQMRFADSIGQNRTTLASVASTNVRVPLPNAPGMRPPITPSPHSMTTSAAQLPVASPSQQADSMMSSNQQSPLNVMLPEQQQRAMMSPGSPMVMSPPVRTSGSPRRNSFRQSSGGKKKKPTNQSNASQSSPHTPSCPPHPMTQQFSPNPQIMFSSQQQMMTKHRMANMGDSPNMPGQVIGGDCSMTGHTGVPRFHGVPQRFGNPAMMQQDENMQHIHQQQLMQMQQHQQMQRMAMARQTQPGVTGQISQVDAMQQRWPRQTSDPSFTPKPLAQQGFPPRLQNTSNTAMTRPPGQTATQQVNVQTMNNQQNAVSQHYTPALVNRFPSQMNLQDQQMMFQQMQQQQQRPPASRFPNSTSLEAAGMSGISPLALQQGLLNAAQMQADNPPLVHPSLQFPKGEQPITTFHEHMTSQVTSTCLTEIPTPIQSPSGAVTPKKRTKSRRKTDGGEDETKSRPRQRSSKAKKPSAVSTTTAPMMSPNMAATMSTSITAHPSFPVDGVKMLSPERLGYPGMPSTAQGGFSLHQTTIQGSHPQAFRPQQPPTNQIPVCGDAIVQASAQPVIRQTPLPATKPVQATAPNKQEAPLIQSKECVEPESVAVQSFIDPLTYTIKEVDSQYNTRDPADSVPQSLFLLGCVFHIIEYNEIITDTTIIPLWGKMIEKYGGLVENQYTKSCTHLLCVSCTSNLFKQALLEGKRCVTVYWLNDVLQLRTLRVPWLAIHLPTRFSYTHKPAVNLTMTYTGFHCKERERLKMMGLVCGVKFTGFLSRSHAGLLCKRSGSLKFKKASSWLVPCVSSLWLREMIHSDGSTAIDITQPKFQKFDDENETIAGFLLDLSKSRQLLESWKTYIPLTQDCLDRVPLKRGLQLVPTSMSLPKRARLNEPPQPLPRVCFTGIPPAFVQGLKQKLEIVGGRSETTFALCSHLVAQNVSRTVKFLSCISSCQYIVTPDWIEECAKSNRMLDENDFLLVDKVAEEKFKFSLQESVKRANKRPLFKDCLFCVTPKVTPGRKTLAQIINCAGGKLLNKMPGMSVLKHLKERKAPNTSVYIISCPDDEAIYKPLKSQGLHVHNAEIVLTGVLRQEIDSLSYRL